MLYPNQQCSFKRLTASGLIRSGSGSLSGFLVATGTPTITIYDNTSAAGTVVINGLVTQAGTPYPVPALLTKGAYATITGAGDVTFFYN